MFVNLNGSKWKTKGAGAQCCYTCFACRWPQIQSIESPTRADKDSCLESRRGVTCQCGTGVHKICPMSLIDLSRGICATSKANPNKKIWVLDQNLCLFLLLAPFLTKLRSLKYKRTNNKQSESVYLMVVFSFFKRGD